MVRQTRPDLASLPFDRSGLGTELYAFGLQLVAKLAEVPDECRPGRSPPRRWREDTRRCFGLQEKSQAIKDLTTQAAPNAQACRSR